MYAYIADVMLMTWHDLLLVMNVTITNSKYGKALNVIWGFDGSDGVTVDLLSSVLSPRPVSAGGQTGILSEEMLQDGTLKKRELVLKFKNNIWK